MTEFARWATIRDARCASGKREFPTGSFCRRARLTLPSRIGSHSGPTEVSTRMSKPDGVGPVAGGLSWGGRAKPVDIGCVFRSRPGRAKATREPLAARKPNPFHVARLQFARSHPAWRRRKAGLVRAKLQFGLQRCVEENKGVGIRLVRVPKLDRTLSCLPD